MAGKIVGGRRFLDPADPLAVENPTPLHRFRDRERLVVVDHHD
jgi:hypothetical protein